MRRFSTNASMLLVVAALIAVLATQQWRMCRLETKMRAIEAGKTKAIALSKIFDDELRNRGVLK